MVNVDKIRSLSKKQGIKLIYLTQTIGVQHTYFADVKRHNRDIPDERLTIIADILNTTVEYLRDQTENPSPAQNDVDLNKKILPVQMDESDTQLLDLFHRLNENGKKRALDSLNDLVQLPRYTEKLYKIKKAAGGGEFTEEYINEEEKNRLPGGVPLDDDTL